MSHIDPDTLMTLEAYAKARKDFRARVLAHKKDRTVALGEHLTLIFEDELTIRYQVQEMLRVERIFEEEGIRDELAAYDPLIPDGSNCKATMLIEYPDVAERQAQLAVLRGIEDKVWIEVAGHARVYAIADEDMDRSTEQKTSAVHFLRFDLDAMQVDAFKRGTAVELRVDHPRYAERSVLTEASRSALATDFD